LGYHQVKEKKKDTHGTTFRSYYEFFVIPVEMTNAPDTLNSCMQLQRILLLLFDTLIRYNRTWEDNLWHMDESWGIMDMTKIFHLDYVVSAQGAQEEIQDIMDQCTKIPTDRVVDGIIYHGGLIYIVLKYRRNTPTLVESA
jgi:hypothetical protein